MQDHDHSGEGVSCQKYLGFPGIPTRLYNTQAVVTAHDVIEVTEGEIDALTLNMCGLHAVGVAGASNWKGHFPRVFAGFDLVRIWGDGDKAGHQFARDVASGIGPSARIVKLPDNEDVNSFYLANGKDAIHGFAESVR